MSLSGSSKNTGVLINGFAYKGVPDYCLWVRNMKLYIFMSYFDGIIQPIHLCVSFKLCC